MRIGIMQPYFFPYIGYWQLMNAVDEYVIYDDVNYIKRGWINRNNILYNGTTKRINLMIQNASQNRLIMDTTIAETRQDMDRLLSVLKQAYKKAPFFEEIYCLLEDIITYPTNNLVLYLKNQIEKIHDYLGMRSKIILSSEIEKNVTLKGEDKIIEICKRRGADCYINAIGGQQLYDNNHFREQNILLFFLKTNEITYKQFENKFAPNLSIIDVLMFNSKEQISDMLTAYTLIEGEH